MKNRSIILLVLSSIFATTLQAVPVQWTVAEGGNGHFYEAISVPEKISWANAKVAAELSDGYLATITSAAENDFVFNLIDDPIFWSLEAGPWLGGYQPSGSPEPDGNWQWVTGEPFDYTHWRSGEPSNSPPGENVLHFGEYPLYSNLRSSYWNDVPDQDPWRRPSYIIETPEPATLLLLGLGGLMLRKRS